MCGVNIVKGLYDRLPQLLRNPAALGQAIFDSGDAAISLLRVVVGCVDDDFAICGIGKQIARQVWNIPHRNGYDYYVTASGCLGNRDRRGASLSSQLGEAFRSP